MNHRLENLLPVQDVRLDGDVDQKGLREVGLSTPRRDAISHVTGRTVYFEDVHLSGDVAFENGEKSASSRANSRN